MRLHGEGGVDRVFRWLAESGVTVEELRHTFRRDPFALRLIDQYINPRPAEPPSSVTAGASAFERAVDSHLAPLRGSSIYERHRGNLLASDQFVDMLAWLTRYRTIASARVLDDGCGAGAFLVTSHEQGAGTVVGVEIDLSMARLSRVRSDGRRSVYCLMGTGESLPFRSATFDLAVSSHVIEHVADQRRYLAEIARVLRPGGALLLACPNRLWPREQHSELRYLTYLPNRLARTLAGLLHDLLCTLDVGSDQRVERLEIASSVPHFVSPFTVQRLARGAGLRVIVLNPVERFVQTWPGITRRFTRPRWLLRLAAFLFSIEILAVLEKPPA